MHFNKLKLRTDQKWSSLVHSLNGLFCTSILEMLPKFSGQPKLMDGCEGSSSCRYGALSGESVCTENMKSWKKMLPCKQVNRLIVRNLNLFISA
jgi:hypothetical protein